MSRRRNYWCKMPWDFGRKHYMMIMQSMPNGHEYQRIYILLLLESVRHDGKLRFSEKIPYTDEMLAAIVHVSTELLKEAMDVFDELELVERQEDGTIFFPEVTGMIGSETDAAKYMRERRDKSKELSLGEFQNVNITKDEFEKLKEFYPSFWSEYVEKLSMHKKSKGKVYDSDYATLRQWLRMDIGDME